jgi:uncharacterized protein YgbK (DUF1537 family)
VVVVGTAHPVAVRQAEALAAREDVACVDIDPVGDRVNVTGGPLAGAGVVLVRFAFDRPTPAPDAQAYIGAALHAQVRELPMPRCVIVTGGATVRALGDALGATRIDVQGEHEPGIPIARWADGAWAHVPLVTKSGGFGGPDLVIRLSASYARSPLEEA